jgi:hypothetical protein
MLVRQTDNATVSMIRRNSGDASCFQRFGICDWCDWNNRHRFALRKSEFSGCSAMLESFSFSSYDINIDVVYVVANFNLIPLIDLLPFIHRIGRLRAHIYIFWPTFIEKRREEKIV